MDKLSWFYGRIVGNNLCVILDDVEMREEIENESFLGEESWNILKTSLY